MTTPTLPEDTLLIAAADTHVDEYNWADRPQICYDSMWAFQWIVRLAGHNRKPLVLAGDITDRAINNAKITAFLRDQVGPVFIYFVQGQHCLQQIPWLSAVDSSEMDEKVAEWLPQYTDGLVPLALNGRKIFGIDWTPPGELPAKLAAIPKDTDIVVMHQVMQEFMGSITTPEMTARQVPYAKLLIVGDYHHTKVVTTTGATGQTLTVLSPGSTNMREISEPDDKYVFIVKQDLSYETLRIPTRIKFATDIYNEEFLNDFVQTIQQDLQKARDLGVSRGLPEELRKPLVRIRFDPEIPLAYQRIRQAVGDLGHLFTDDLRSREDVTEEVEAPSGAEDEEMHQNIRDFGLVSCLPQHVDQETDPELFNFVRRLVDENAPVAEIIAEERRKHITDDPS